MKWEIQTSVLNYVFSLVISITPSFLRQLKTAKGHQRLLPQVGSHTVLPNFFSSSVNMNIFKGTFMVFIFKRDLVIFCHTIYKIQHSFWRECNSHYNISLPFPFPFPSPPLLPSALPEPLQIMLLLYLTTVMNYDSVLRMTVMQHIHTNFCCAIYSVQM